MTGFLASVANPDEAAIALAEGADIIDLKDPARGALGAVDPAVVTAVLALVAGRVPVSAVAGDLPLRVEVVLPAVAALRHLDFVKLGLFPGADPRPVIQALAPFTRETRLIAVLFADRAPDFSLLPLLAEAGFMGAMLDTAGKGEGRLLAHMDMPALLRFVRACRAVGLTAGLAGALELPDVPRLLLLNPDTLGFRGALTRGARSDAIDPARVRAVRQLIPHADIPAGGSSVDYRLLAARGYAPAAEGDPTVTDRVTVRELVLPVSIGAYAHERAAPQRVRFTVTALVARRPRESQDMRDVFSYDVITDGIRLLTAGAHFDLAETLAEQLARLVLEHPRVVKVTIGIEKLETGAGVVGVEIERNRQTLATATGPARAVAPGA